MPSSARNPLPAPWRGHKKRQRSHRGKSRPELEPESASTRSLSAQWLAAPRAAGCLSCQGPDSPPTRGAPGVPAPAGSLVGSPHAQRALNIAFLFPLCTANRSPLPFPSTSVPSSAVALLTSPSRSPLGRSRGSPGPAEPMPAARLHPRPSGSAAPPRSRVSVLAAPSDFSKPSLRASGAPGVARRQAAAQAASTRSLPPHLTRPLRSPRRLATPRLSGPAARATPTHSGAAPPPVFALRGGARTLLRAGAAAREPPPARHPPRRPLCCPRCRGGRDLPPGQGDPLVRPGGCRLVSGGSERGARGGAAPASAPGSLPRRPALPSATSAPPGPALAARARSCPALTGALGAGQRRRPGPLGLPCSGDGVEPGPLGSRARRVREGSSARARPAGGRGAPRRAARLSSLETRVREAAAKGSGMAARRRRRERPRAEAAPTLPQAAGPRWGSRLAGGPGLVFGNVGDRGWGKGRPLGTRRADLPPGSEKRWLPSVLKASPGANSWIFIFSFFLFGLVF